LNGLVRSDVDAGRRPGSFPPAQTTLSRSGVFRSVRLAWRVDQPPGYGL